MVIEKEKLSYKHFKNFLMYIIILTVFYSNVNISKTFKLIYCFLKYVYCFFFVE